MEQTQSTSSGSRPFKEFVSPSKKRKMSHLSQNEKFMIINVFKHVKNTWPADKYQSKLEIKDKTAAILGISKSSVYRVLKEYVESDTVKPAASPKKRLTIIEKVDDFDKSCIRKIVYGFYLKGELPTTKKILKTVNDDETLPNLGITSLKKILKHLKFKYVKRSRNKFCLVDRDDIAILRINYLEKMRRFREQERPIYYLDETWVNAGHTVGKVRENTTGKSRRQALEGLSTGAKNPNLKGNKLIILHIGGENGFITGSELVFECKGTDDYPESMNTETFEKWFEETLPRLEPNAVVVMDNASYHSRRKAKTPIERWNKAQIQNWLVSKNIAFEQKDTKVQLMQKVKAVKQQFKTYIIDEMAKEVGVEVLRLPPFHCELNPIELIWPDVKGYVARNNSTFKMADVKKLLKEGLNQITAEKWQKCIGHVKQEEKKYESLDNKIDNTVDSFIIDTAEDSSDMESDSSDMESDSSDTDSFSVTNIKSEPDVENDIEESFMITDIKSEPDVKFDINESFSVTDIKSEPDVKNDIKIEVIFQ